jgi:predicted O-methyltransferase YrrM
MCWNHGALPRIPLIDIMPGAHGIEIRLPNALDRKFGTSVTMEEACQLCVIERFLKARRVLEIGTYDGNTSLALAANLETGGAVVTVDLPPDFDLERQKPSLMYPDGFINLTPREQLGRQYRDHPLSNRVTQVYGDSAALDWSTLGGPFELVFIDGCHTAEYVRSDTLNALDHLAEGGAIVWHDYGMIPEVSEVVDWVAKEKVNIKVCAIEGTRLAIGLKHR